MSDVKVLDLLWGTGQRPARGPKPALTIDEIVRVAVEVADAEGLPAVTMRRIATELGFTTMALYRHVPGKHELMQLMVDAATSGFEDDVTDPGDWRDGLAAWAVDYYRIMHAHPWLLGSTTISPAVGPNRVAFMERGLRALAGTGMSGADMTAILLTLTGYAHGAAQVFLGAAASAEAHGVSDSQFGIEFGHALSRVVTSDRFPVLARVLAEGVFDLTEEDDDMQDFRFGLDRILDGVAAYVERAG